MMRMSEAMRLGAMLRPQAFGVQWDGVGTCAMGAAFEAAHGSANYVGEVFHPWPRLFALRVASPVTYDGVSWFRDVVTQLNDCHGWTRERIADWIATLPEDAPEATAAAREPVTA